MFILKRTVTLTTAAMLGIQMLAVPARAMSDEEKAGLAAAAILGLAALAHNQNHHQQATHTTNANSEAEFERGYRDGVHNEAFDASRSNDAFAQGYEAGQKERSNSLAYKQSNVAGTKVPKAALDSCISDAAAAMNVGGQDIHVIKAAQEGSDTFYIEVASGHKHLVCQVNSQGQIFDTRYGRL